MKSRVSWSYESNELLDVVESFLHNIVTPCPQLCGRHTGGLHHPPAGLAWAGQLCPHQQALHRGLELALAAEKDPADKEASKGDLPADHPLRPDELGVTVSCSGLDFGKFIAE